MSKITNPLFSKQTQIKLAKAWPKLSPQAKKLISSLEDSAKSYQKSATKKLITKSNVT